MTEPLISIIVPAYNAEKYIEDCVASMSLDVHPEVEAVLVNDGSTDSTAVLCERLARKYSAVKVVNKENGGSNSARNAGVRNSNGSWIWFVDADDILRPDALDNLKLAIEADPTQLLHFRIEPFEEGEQVKWSKPDSFSVETMSSKELLRMLYRGQTRHNLMGFLFSRELINGSAYNEAFEEGFALYEDVVFIQTLLSQDITITYLDCSLYGYRQNENSLTHKSSKAVATSGYMAVKKIDRLPVSEDDICLKKNMEVGLLFTAYRLLGQHGGLSLEGREIRSLIGEYVNEIGLMKLSPAKLFRFLLLKTGLMDRIIAWRESA